MRVRRRKPKPNQSHLAAAAAAAAAQAATLGSRAHTHYGRIGDTTTLSSELTLSLLPAACKRGAAAGCGAVRARVRARRERATAAAGTLAACEGGVAVEARLRRRATAGGAQPQSTIHTRHGSGDGSSDGSGRWRGCECGGSRRRCRLRPGQIPGAATMPFFLPWPCGHCSRSTLPLQFLKELGITAENPGVYNGAWGGSGALLSSLSPTTGEVLATIRQATEAEYESCLVAMEAARAVWAEVRQHLSAAVAASPTRVPVRCTCSLPAEARAGSWRGCAPDWRCPARQARGARCPGFTRDGQDPL